MDRIFFLIFIYLVFKAISNDVELQREIVMIFAANPMKCSLGFMALIWFVVPAMIPNSFARWVDRNTRLED